VRQTLLLALLAALTAPAVASAVPDATAEGTLALRGGDGRLALVGFKGAFIGRVDDGRLTIVEPKSGSCDTPLVWNWESVQEKTIPGGELGQGLLACVYSGVDMRFRLTGTMQEVRLKGQNIGASIAGRGTAIVEGDGGFFDGMYSLNGDDFRSLPDEAARFVLGTSTVAP
jgi:hypothetical protein